MRELLERKKYVFVKNLEMTLFLDRERNDLEGIDYIYDKETDDEIITITFAGGGVKTILATSNSNGANARAIIDTIYGWS